ncbi:MAG: V-type ATP synthase subunit D, partial [Spirochaetales bacterium]|nr:V-type ATP synthase subunit D [Spirochaetales bacterium]
DRGVNTMKELAALNAEIEVLEEQKRLLDDEMRTTTQRVNLFEKVKIPETKEVIRKIGIYLGDQQTAAVVRGKMAKGKVVKEV